MANELLCKCKQTVKPNYVGVPVTKHLHYFSVGVHLLITICIDYACTPKHPSYCNCVPIIDDRRKG